MLKPDNPGIIRSYQDFPKYNPSLFSKPHTNMDLLQLHKESGTSTYIMTLTGIIFLEGGNNNSGRIEVNIIWSNGG